MEHPPKMAEFDENRVTAESRVFASELFARFPEFRQHAAMERLHNEDRWTLVMHVRAPSGDPRCELVVWVDGGYEPSVQYGGWHTHQTVWGACLAKQAQREALLDLIDEILADRIVICADVDKVGGVDYGRATILDLSDPDALMAELTRPYSSGRARLWSWSGGLDRVASLEDLERNEPAE